MRPKQQVKTLNKKTWRVCSNRKNDQLGAFGCGFLSVNKESIEKEANESNFRVISEDFVNKSTVCLETISAEDNSIEEEISVDAVTDDIGAIN